MASSSRELVNEHHHNKLKKYYWSCARSFCLLSLTLTLLLLLMQEQPQFDHAEVRHRDHHDRDDDHQVTVVLTNSIVALVTKTTNERAAIIISVQLEGRHTPSNVKQPPDTLGLQRWTEHQLLDPAECVHWQPRQRQGLGNRQAKPVRIECAGTHIHSLTHTHTHTLTHSLRRVHTHNYISINTHTYIRNHSTQ